MRPRPTTPTPTSTAGAHATPPPTRAATGSHGTSRVLLAAVAAGAVLAWADVPTAGRSTTLPTTASDAVLALVGVTRWAALATCAYVVVVTTLSLVGHRRSSRRLTRLAEQLAVPALRRVLRTSAGTALGIGLLLPGTALAEPPTGPSPTGTDAPAATIPGGPGTPDGSPTPRLELLDPPSSGTGGGAAPTLVLLNPPQPPATTATTAGEAQGTAGTAPSPAAGAPRDPAEHTGRTSTTTAPPEASPSPAGGDDGHSPATTVGAPTPSSAPAPPDRPPAPSPADGGDPDRTTPSPRTDPSGVGDPAPHLPAGQEPTGQDPTTPGSSDRPTAADPSPPPGELRTWTIRPGEHLWLVAERVVEAGGGDPQDVASVARYHQRLIATNRHRLPVPEDPDLVLPGMVVDCPPLAA